MRRSNGAARLPETYQWLLVPEQANPQAPNSWQVIRLSGADALAVRASKKLRADDLLVTTLGSTVLRKHLDEVIAHLAGQVGAEVTVTLEIEASLPGGTSDQIARTVTENSRTLKFTSHGFESE